MERKNSQEIVRVVTPDGWIRPVRVPKRVAGNADLMVSFLVREGHLEV